MKNIVCLGLFLLSACTLSAQNLQISNLSSNPFIICPAQVGNSENPRASLLYKNDWSGKCLAGFDAPLKKFHGGFGVNAIYENQLYNRTGLSVRGVYSYRWKINDDFSIRSAAFVDDVYTHQGDFVSDDTNQYFSISHSHKNYIDEGLSLAFDYKKISFGASCFHLLRPDIGVNSIYRLNRTYSFYVGYNLWMMKGEKHKGIGVSPLLYVTNENSDFNGTLGFDFIWNSVFAGAFYRLGSLDISTLIYHAGARIGRFQFGYAFDKTESQLLFANGSGHEVFLNYFFYKD